METDTPLHLVEACRAPAPKKTGWAQLAEQPLTPTELRVIMGWHGGRVTAAEVVDGRTRTQSGVCFALLDGGLA